MNGILLAIQFFTVYPVRKELPLGRKEVTAMYIALPFVGATIGLVLYALSTLLLNNLGFGTMLTAILVVLASIVLTGGLHLDGWADTGDAFFSYKDRTKRLEIMEDPRIGAFGTMALVFLVLVKVGIFHEVFTQGHGSLLLFTLIPLLTRVGMALCFVTLPVAKNTGIAFFFKEKIQMKTVVISVSLTGIIALCGFIAVTWNLGLALIFAAVLVVAIVVFRRWAEKHFGGITGDLAGAFIEGMEVVFWLVVLVLP